MLTLLLLLTTAQAGPLADGFRGTPWGAPFDRAEPPANTAGCSPFVGKAGSMWTCPVEIGGHRFAARYLYGRAGLMVAKLEPEGFAGCTTLRAAAMKLYGEGKPRWLHPSSDHLWRDGTADALYEGTGGSCRLVLTDGATFARHDAAEAAAIQDDAL